MFTRLFAGFRLLLPLLVLVCLNCWPAPAKVGQALELVRQTGETSAPGIAARMLRIVAEYEPYRLDLWERIGLDALAAGETQDALAALRKAQESGSISPRGLEGIGNAFEVLKNEEGAAAAWAQLADIPGYQGEALSHLIRIKRSSGDLGEALSAARQWQSLDHSSPGPAYLLAVFTASDSPNEAVSWMETSAKLDGRYQPALVSLRKAAGQVELSHDPGYRLTVMGRWLGGQGEWDLAEAAFERAAKASPAYAEAWAFWGQARQQNGKNGLEELQKAVSLDPNSVLARALLALYWGNQGDFARAIEQMQQVVKLEPKQSVWLVELGNLTGAGGDLVKALTYFKQAIALDPQNPAVYAALARFSLSYSADLRGVGLPAAQQWVELSPKDAQALDATGAILAGLGDLRGAERFLQQALEIKPELASAHYHLGQVYLQLQDQENSLYELKEAARLDGTGQTGLLARRMLERYFGLKYP